jgi:hypothetical protein
MMHGDSFEARQCAEQALIAVSADRWPRIAARRGIEFEWFGTLASTNLDDAR